MPLPKERQGGECKYTNCIGIKHQPQAGEQTSRVSKCHTVYDIEGNGFWMATEEAADRMHLASIEPDPMLGATNVIKDTLHREGEKNPVIGENEWIGAIITPIDQDNPICIELYDSDATWHISLYKSNFTSYLPLAPPIFLNSTNQQYFPAIGCGTLVVKVPNNGTESELTLHGALHTPAVSYILVSIMTLDEKGYHAHIGAGHLELTSSQGKRVSHIP